VCSADHSSVNIETSVTDLIAVLLESRNPDSERIKWAATPDQLRILARIKETQASPATPIIPRPSSVPIIQPTVPVVPPVTPGPSNVTHAPELPAEQPAPLENLESEEEDAVFITMPITSFAKRTAVMPSFKQAARQKGVCLQYITTEGQLATILPERVLPDTCSTVNVMSLKFAQENKIPVSEKMDNPLKGIGGAARSGTTTEPVTILFGQGSNFAAAVVADFFIVDSPEIEFDIIIGAQSMRNFGAEISYLHESFTYYPNLPKLDKSVKYSLPLRMSAPLKEGHYQTSQIIRSQLVIPLS